MARRHVVYLHGGQVVTAHQGLSWDQFHEKGLKPRQCMRDAKNQTAFWNCLGGLASNNLQIKLNPLAEIPGHDLTYQAEVNLVPGMTLPASLFADMGGALMASEAVLKAVIKQRSSGKGIFHEVALSDAAAWLALPRQWGMTLPKGAVGGAHAGYNMYACKNGRVAVAALEPHFAKSLCDAAGIVVKDGKTLFAKSTHDAIASFLASKTRQQLDKLAADKDIPLMTLPKAL